MHTSVSAGAPRHTRLRWAALAASTALAASALAVVTAPGAAEAQPSWTDVAEATIRPGSELVTEGGGQCTANFVFTEGDRVLIGSAAHCTGTGAATDVNGCDAGTLPLGTRVSVEGADHPATLTYSSWEAMQRRGETDANACMFNDFALLELDARDHDKVNPTVPHWGGPVALSEGTAVGDRVFSYGNSSLRQGLDLLKPKTGLSLGQASDGWTHPVYTVTPGIPGDSGSAFLDAQGAAMGVVSTLALAPLPLSNGVSDLPRALAYAQADGLDAQLALGTESFSPDQLPLGGLPDLGGGIADGGSDAPVEEPAADEPDEGGIDSPVLAEVEVNLFGRSFGFGL